MAKKKKKTSKKKKKANPAQSKLQVVIATDLEACLTNLCLASVDEEDDVPTYKRLSITDDVVAEFQAIATKVFDRISKNFDTGNIAVRPYHAISKLDKHEIEHVDLSTHKNVNEQIAGLSDLSKLPKFAKKDQIDSALKFYVLIFEADGDDPIYFYRACSPKMEIHQSSKFALIFDNGEYDTFKESIFVFDRGIDCFSYKDDLYVLNKGRFESLFQFFEEVKEAASETLETIRTTIPIHNFDELESACLGHLQMLKKLKNIASQPYLSRIKMSDIKAVIKEMGLSLKVKKFKGKEKLTFDSKDKWEILRLLDDDYLKSVMTGEKYEVNSKRTV